MVVNQQGSRRTGEQIVTRDVREVLGNPQWKRRMALEWVRLGPKLGCQALFAGGGSSISLLYCHYLCFLLPYGFPANIQK